MAKDIVIENVSISAETKRRIVFNHKRTPGEAGDLNLHLHDMLEIYVYVSGDADFIIGDSYKRLRYGDVLFTFPNELHRPVIKSSEEYERFYITVSLDAFDDFIDSPISCFLEVMDSDSRIIELSDEDRCAFLRILEKISEHLRTGGSGGYLTYSYFLRAMHILNGAKSVGIPEDARLAPILRDVLAYISDNYASISTVSEIAKHFHVSSSYLSSLFSSSMKVGIKQYLQYKKISGAKIMLSKGASVTDVCFECGFNSCSHFISVFKAATGITPNKYRAREMEE